MLVHASANQRVLVHRARSKVRGALERYLGDEVMAAFRAYQAERADE